MKKHISNQTEWAEASKELEQESIKLASYDKKLLEILEDISGKSILDFGCGPGILASALKEKNANIKTFDISKEMRDLCVEKIGKENVFSKLEEVPVGEFDNIICNLVLCIVRDNEVKDILKNLKCMIKPDGRILIGFCNPKIFNVSESQLDLRPIPLYNYNENHRYLKTKKEGGYQIVEEHRPIDWYRQIFKECGLTIIKEHFTSKYGINGREIQDFIIFEIKKER
jgi:2-polyprenyl-3-methyl-5-hydroxy-6-metoxy-1,4-benzoquinol methylase